ncbi:histidine kinase [Paracrocinitomix mangrovi]|uniref:tetratricopeptide repeat-containing sensor histidine kinase n=1 Tax=Paracrocinitomix mangrovi TaxID=2862509 RepID=UPI001C8E4218|nr:histidine kinase [Paracrocinitomix mangrovi]UKN01473.1 histidine kinase [Paracrocinitomix mangrovi]
MRFIVVMILAFLPLLSTAQIYQGVKELEPYKNELSELDKSLKSDPSNFLVLYPKMLKKAEENEDEALRAMLFIYQGSYLYYINDMDSAAFYFNRAIDLSKSINNKPIYRTARIRKIFTDEYKKTKYLMAKDMEQVYIDSYNDRDTLNMIYSLNGLGVFYGDIDSVSLSLMIYYEALKLSDASNNQYEKGFILNNLGLIKYELGALDSAASDFKNCLEIGLETGNLGLQGIGRQNLGLYYSRVDSNDRAKEEYLKVMQIGKEFGYKNYELSSITNLATLEMSMGNPETSDSLSKEALRIAKEGRILFGITPIYLGRAYYKLRIEKYDEALQMLDSAEAYSKYATYSEVMPPLYHLTYRVYEEKGDYKNAFEAYKLKVAVQDSINELGNDKLLAELQFKYDDEKKERIRSIEKNQLKLQIKQGQVDMAKFQQNVVIIISVFLLVIFFIVIMYFRLKQKSDNLFSFTIANKLEEERGRIARDLHDGLGQSMIVLKNKFNNLKDVDEEQAELLNTNFSEVIEEVRSISRSLIPPELRRLGLMKAVLNMLGEIEKSTGMIVTTEIDVLEKLDFEEHQSIRIYRIIQELVTNTVKHANATSIKLEAFKVSKELILLYQDNGDGLDMEKWRSAENSVGFKSIQQRLKYLNGNIKVEKPKVGFKVEIIIPLS